MGWKMPPLTIIMLKICTPLPLMYIMNAGMPGRNTMSPFCLLVVYRYTCKHAPPYPFWPGTPSLTVGSWRTGVPEHTRCILLPGLTRCPPLSSTASRVGLSQLCGFVSGDGGRGLAADEKRGKRVRPCHHADALDVARGELERLLRAHSWRQRIDVLIHRQAGAYTRPLFSST